MMTKKIWLLMAIIGLAGCAHQTPFSPSQGHIGSEQDNQQKVAPAGEIPKPVKKLTYVPPPKPKAKEQTYSVVVSDVPVKEVLFALARESKLNVDIHPAVDGKVTLNAVDQTLPAILDRLSKQIDLQYKVEGNVISIAPDAPVLRTYKLDYVNMAKALDKTEISVGKSETSDSQITIKSDAIADFWKFITNDINAILATSRSQKAGEQELSALIDKASLETTRAILEQATKKDSENESKDSTALKDAQKAKDAVDELKKKLGEAEQKIVVNKLAGTFTALATEKQHAFIQQYVDTVMASVRRQVLIEATIVEVTLNDRFQQGIDWSRLSGGTGGFSFTQNLGGTARTSVGTITPILPGSQFVAGFVKSTAIGDLAASIRLLNVFGDTRVLSSPKIMALNNQVALLKVVDNIVYFKVDVTPGNAATPTTPATNPTYSTSVLKAPVGVVMSVTPQINANGNVSLNVRPTISRILRFVNDPNPDLARAGVTNPVPEIQVREMESLLQVGSGQTVVLGGLMQDNLANKSDSVPGVSSLPLIGKLFEGKDDTRTKTELVIFLRPTVISNASLESNELKSFKQYLPEQQLPVASDEPAN